MLDRSNIRSMGSWAGFIGIMSIIGGIISCISIVGIIPGIISIILGIKLRNAKKYSAELAATQDLASEAGRLNMLFAELGGFFKINGILMIIGLVFTVLGIIVVIGSWALLAAWLNEISSSFSY